MNTIISGAIWAVLFVALGIYGAKLGGWLGAIVSFAGWLFAALSVITVWRHSLSNKKCHHCGVVDSVHAKDEGRSKLVWALGPKDDDGLQMYLFYCRSCGFVNIYKPGWFGNINFNRYMDAREVYKAYQDGQMKREEMTIFFGGKILLALIEDGILPKDWAIV